jgi:hypothetical protein
MHSVVTQFEYEQSLIGVHKAFSTLPRLAPLHRQNSRLMALRQLPLRPLRLRRQGARKIFKSRRHEASVKLSHYHAFNPLLII